jgi:hypothetical protein
MANISTFLSLITVLGLISRVVYAQQEVVQFSGVPLVTHNGMTETSPRRITLRHIRSPVALEKAKPGMVQAGSVPDDRTSDVSATDQVVNEPETVEQSGIPVGGWVGIGFGIVLVLLVAVYFIIGQRKVTEYFVRVIRDRIQRRDKKYSKRQHDQETLDSLEVRCSSKSENRQGSRQGSSIGYYETNVGTPITVHDIPVAPIEIEPDGRMSPKLPIASRRLTGSSMGATHSP